MVDVSVIIVNYNTPVLTRNCIASVLEKTKKVVFEIILVDNASTAHDAQELKEVFPAIHLIKSSSNLGFARGNNLGIESATGKYILLLNSDTVLINDAVSMCYTYMEQHEKVGVVSAQLQYPDGRLQSACQRFPAFKYSAMQLLRLHKLLSRRKKASFLLGSYFDHQQTVVCDWVWGTFFFFKREILEKLPGKKLNDDYFMYMEDMQWCMDIGKLGYEVHYYPEAKLVHYMGGSSGQRDGLIHKNADKFLRKNYSAVHRLLLTAVERFK